MLTRNCPLANSPKGCLGCKTPGCLTDRKRKKFPVVCRDGRNIEVPQLRSPVAGGLGAGAGPCGLRGGSVYGGKPCGMRGDSGRLFSGARLLDLTTPGDFFTGAWNSGGKLGGKCLKPGWENRDKGGNHGIFRLWKSGDVENFPVKARRRYGRKRWFLRMKRLPAPGPASPAADTGQRGL